MGKERLTGAGDINADLTMSGLDEAAIRSSLNGTANFAFRDGAVKGINVAGLIRNAQARLAGKPVDDSAPQQTDFSELSGSATIRNGLVNNQDLSAKSPLLRVSGKGQVDLPGDTIDYLLTTEVVKSLEGQGGAGSNELTGLPVPVRIKGQLADPGFSVDLKTVMESKLKQSVQQKLESRLKGKTTDESSTEEKPASKLKDLFRGLR
jgi:AsmA protein